MDKYGRLAQLGEHLLDVQGVRGSSPLASTILLALYSGARGAMDSVFDSDSKGCRFESCRAHQILHDFRDVAQLGSALASGARGRVFKSRRPDHFFV